MENHGKNHGKPMEHPWKPMEIHPKIPGDTFQGAYAENRKCGHGVYTWADGTVESGEYLEGQKHGKHRWVKGDLALLCVG